MFDQKVIVYADIPNTHGYLKNPGNEFNIAISVYPRVAKELSDNTIMPRNNNGTKYAGYLKAPPRQKHIWKSNLDIILFQ